VKGQVCAVDGTPETTPVEGPKLNPAQSEPEDTLQLIGGVQFAVPTAWE